MFRVTLRVSDNFEFCVWSGNNFNEAMNYFRLMDIESPQDSIISFYLKDGTLLRKWWAGREVNKTAS